MSDSSPMNDHETTSHDNSSRTTSNSQKSPPLSQKKCITVVDSMEVISKLISEIQSMDRLELEIPSQPPSSSNPPPEDGFFHFSLAKKSCAVTNSTSSLPLLKSLSFNKFSSFPKVSHWLQLHGCYMVLCYCQSYGLVRVGFLS